MKRPVLEYCYKNDELGDPMVNEYHILAMDYATEDELKLIAEYSLKINQILSDYLKEVNIDLKDFKLEFGRSDCACGRDFARYLPFLGFGKRRKTG